MTSRQSDHRPGDILLNRYLVGADETTRERAREIFAELARLMDEAGSELLAPRGDSPDQNECGKIPPNPQL